MQNLDFIKTDLAPLKKAHAQTRLKLQKLRNEDGGDEARRLRIIVNLEAVDRAYTRIIKHNEKKIRYEGVTQINGNH